MAKTKLEIEQIISNFRNKIENEMHMFYHYEWDQEYFFKKYREYSDSYEKITKEELLQFSVQELQEMGFLIWSREDDLSILLLIPLKLVSLLDPEMEVESISRNTEKLRNTDKDIRFGCIAFGIRFEKDNFMRTMPIINQHKLDEIEMTEK